MATYTPPPYFPQVRYRHRTRTGIGSLSCRWWLALLRPPRRGGLRPLAPVSGSFERGRRRMARETTTQVHKTTNGISGKTHKAAQNHHGVGGSLIRLKQSWIEYPPTTVKEWGRPL